MYSSSMITDMEQRLLRLRVSIHKFYRPYWHDLLLLMLQFEATFAIPGARIVIQRKLSFWHCLTAQHSPSPHPSAASRLLRQTQPCSLLDCRPTQSQPPSLPLPGTSMRQQGRHSLLISISKNHCSETTGHSRGPVLGISSCWASSSALTDTKVCIQLLPYIFCESLHHILCRSSVSLNIVLRPPSKGNTRIEGVKCQSTPVKTARARQREEGRGDEAACRLCGSAGVQHMWITGIVPFPLHRRSASET